jgi:hypothetical protein
MSAKIQWRFAPAQIFLTQSDAWSVLHFIFGRVGLSHTQLTIADCAFAQGLLLEAIDASAKVGFAEAFFRSATNPSPTLKGVIWKLAKYAFKSWWKHAKGDDLKNPKIYKMVRNELTVRYKSIWGIRLNTGDLDY